VVATLKNGAHKNDDDDDDDDDNNNNNKLHGAESLLRS
jgi:hypothetical protein